MRWWFTLVALVVMAGSASADDRDKADALFKQGKKLMEQKRYADACDAFEQSYKLDPGIGAQLNIARCYEEWGKIGRAFVVYKQAEKMAQDAKDAREAKIHELIVALEPNVPHITLKLPKDVTADRLTVTLDSEPVTTFGEPIVVDPGPHSVEYYLAGSGRKQSQVIALDRGGSAELVLETKNKTPPPVGSGPPKPSANTGRNQRIAGVVLGSAGIVAIGVSTVIALSARGTYNDALEMYCGGMKNNCSPMGLDITHDARSTANKATVVFLLGAGMVIGGGALYLLAPKPAPAGPPGERAALYVAPSIGPDGAGLVFGGSL